MSVIGMKKTLNLHKYSLRVNKIIINWKIIIPICIAAIGLFFGCIAGKGERAVYLKVISFFKDAVINAPEQALLPEYIKYLIYPTIFAGILFFCGMSAYGGFIANLVPFVYLNIIGMISYYMYSTFNLKGLAYCVILLFPYTALSATGIILCASECFNMSDLIIKSISKNNKHTDYSFTEFYQKFFRNYFIIAVSAAVKILLDRLFIALFSF